MSALGVDISFGLQHGLVRDAVVINAANLTLRALKDEAVAFIDAKVGFFFSTFLQNFLV